MTKEIIFGGLSNAKARAKTPADRCYSSQNCTVERGIIESGPRYLNFGARDSWSTSDVCYGEGYGSYAADEIQKLQVTGTPTGGTVVLTFNGVSGGALAQDTGTISYAATASTVKTALEGLAGIAIGDVDCTGGPWPNEPIYVKFKGQYGHTDMAILVLKTNSLTGGSSPTLAITEYTTGGTTSVYLVAIKKDGDSTVTMYKVSTAGVYTSVATGLTASQWFFQQYGPVVYCSNETDGMHTYRIGGAWDDGASSSRPKKPSFPASMSYTTRGVYLNFTAATGTDPLNPTFTVSNVTEGMTQNTDSFSITNNGASITTPTNVAVVVTFAAAKDWQFNDIWRVIVNSASSTEAILRNGSLEFQLVNNDGSPVTINPVATFAPESSQGQIQLLEFFHFANSVRVSRDNVIKLNINFSVESWVAAKTVTISVFKGLSWMMDLAPVSLTGEVNVPTSFTSRRTRYAYSYYNVTTGQESDIQITQPLFTNRIPTSWEGVNVTLTCTGSPELTTGDRIYVYRKDLFAGEWRRLPTDANNLGTFGMANVTSGTTTFTDKWMEEELKDFPTIGLPSFTETSLEGAGPIMTDWKQCLVVGFSRKLWLSYVGGPTVFAPDVDDKTATQQFRLNNVDNPDHGRTVYMSDNRAEVVNNVHGQDSLYAVGPQTSYVMVGDTPATASPPRRLPGARGSVSQRASCRFGGGIEVGSQDGLWYYSVGRGFSGEDNGALVEREETAEVRRSWVTTLIGSSHSNVVVVEYNDQLWIFNGTKYLMRNRELQWQEGTFTDSVTAAIGVRGVGLRFADTYGRLHTIDSAYTDDNTTSVNWNYATGLLDGPEVKGDEIFVQYKGTPRVLVKVYRRDGNLSDTDGRYFQHIFDTPDDQVPYRIPCTIEAGIRYALVLSGTCGTDEVHELSLGFEPSGKQRNG